jgi:hypothetical protein
VGFFYIVAELATSASISNRKLPNRILYEGEVSFLSDDVAPVGGWPLSYFLRLSSLEFSK